jgi:hypothetical protein
MTVDFHAIALVPFGVAVLADLRGRAQRDVRSRAITGDIPQFAYRSRRKIRTCLRPFFKKADSAVRLSMGAKGQWFRNTFLWIAHDCNRAALQRANHGIVVADLQSACVLPLRLDLRGPGRNAGAIFLKEKIEFCGSALWPCRTICHCDTAGCDGPRRGSVASLPIARRAFGLAPNVNSKGALSDRIRQGPNQSPSQLIPALVRPTAARDRIV